MFFVTRRVHNEPRECCRSLFNGGHVTLTTRVLHWACFNVRFVSECDSAFFSFLFREETKSWFFMHWWLSFAKNAQKTNKQKTTKDWDFKKKKKRRWLKWIFSAHKWKVDSGPKRWTVDGGSYSCTSSCVIIMKTSIVTSRLCCYVRRNYYFSSPCFGFRPTVFQSTWLCFPFECIVFLHTHTHTHTYNSPVPLLCLSA